LSVQKFEIVLSIGFFAHHVERGSGLLQSDLQAYARQKDEIEVKQIAMKTCEKLQIFTGAKCVPTSDESPVSHGSYSRGHGIAWQHVASVSIPVDVREKFGSRIGAVGQESLNIRSIILVLARLRDRDAIENDVTLTEG